MSEEWAQSIIKLGLIEHKKSLLSEIGIRAKIMHRYSDGEDAETLMLMESLQAYAALDAFLRDDKATAKLAAEVVKASRK
jgi:hypothetical protein